MSAYLLVKFFTAMKVQIVSKIFVSILGVKITNFFNTFIQFVPQNETFGLKMVVLKTKMAKNIFEIIFILTETETKNYE